MIPLLIFLILHVDGIILKTEDGYLRGYNMETRDGRDILAFSGIPYAKPPVGKLRFKDPQPVEKWTGVRNARDFGQICPQYLNFVNGFYNLTLGNEDCLYLSVYTPNSKPKEKLPVLINYHGGAYFTGFGEILHSPAYLLDHDMVVVSGNYRLGALGFLSLGDDVIPGNFGLKDQNMVIKWVKRNIKYFGGDPNDITLIGESAGASSVHYHLISPLSQGTFNRGISISGSALSPWAFINPNLARKRGLRLAKYLGCRESNSKEILECLRTKDPYEIVNARKMPTPWEQPPDTNNFFPPTVDKHSENPFLPDNPWNLPTYPVPWIMGMSKFEGYVQTGNFVRRPSGYKILEQNFDYIIPISLFYDTTASKPVKISKKIRKFYFGNKTIDQNVLEELTNMYTDSFFFYPTISTARNHTGKVYLYYSSFNSENSYAETFGGVKIFQGPTHTDELIFIWNSNAIYSPLRDKDVILSKNFVRVIYNFMKFDDPAFEGVNFKWPAWNDGEFFLIFGHENRLGRNLMQKQEKFWSRLDFRDLPQKYPNLYR